MSPLERPAPPVGEDIHLPGPTVLPMLLAFSVALALVGATTFWWLIPIGGVVALACLVRWIRETRHAIDRLPPEH